MDRAITLTTFEEEAQSNAALEYWLTRTPAERLAEVDRLRAFYIESLKARGEDGCLQGLRGSLLLVDREEC